MYSSILQKLPLIAVGMLLVIALLRIYLRSKNVTRGEFLRIFKTTKYIQVRILAAVFALTVLFGVFNHIKLKDSLHAIVSLNYSEASQALNSNRTRYNMSEIICDEVVEKAIEIGALENVTVNQLKNCLYVYPYVQGDVRDKWEYHISTEFMVEYHASKHTDHLDAENVIMLISSAYKDYYIEKYTENFELESVTNKPDYSKMEYMDIVSYFNKETTSILNYLYGMARKGGSFVTSNNTTFSSIAGKIHQFKKTQIEQNLKSLVLQHGIAKDKSEYTDRLSYQNSNTDFDRQKNSVSFDLCNDAISMYSEEMTRIVLVPTWDQSGKYYMGRTKVGIDELSVMATDFSDKVASNEKEIMDNNLVIDKMRLSDGSASSHAEADNLIAIIDKAIEDFSKEAVAAGREYSNYKMNQCIAVNVNGFSLFYELKMMILFAIFAYIALMLYSISKTFPKK